MEMDKFTRRAQAFVDNGTVDQVVVIQKRPVTAILAGIAAFVAVAVLLAVLGVSNVIVVGLLGGAALGGVMASQTKNYYLAGVDDTVQMLRLATWTGQPEALVKTLTRPLDITIAKGILGTAVQLDGEKYLLSKLFTKQLDSLSSMDV